MTRSERLMNEIADGLDYSYGRKRSSHHCNEAEGEEVVGSRPTA
jgi:hypothetical protein